MKVIKDENISSRTDLDPLVDQATQLLGREMANSAALAEAHWFLKQDHRGRDYLELRVSDWTSSVSYAFAPDELESREHMQFRLHRLWGDLLMVRSHVQIDGRVGSYQQ